MRRVSRRALLLGAVAASACSGDPPTPGPPAVPAPGTPAPLTDPVTVERLHSTARGRDVDLVLVTPEGVPAAGLPVCLALHGRGSRARVFLDYGLRQALTRTVRAGSPPFAVAAVDGDSYWVDHDPASTGDDPQRMLGEELPGWLATRTLGPDPVAVLGVSMGGFGAFRYARGRSLKAAAAMSAALFLSWAEAGSRHVFQTREQWESNEPLRHADDVLGLPVGLWCGAADPFITADRRYAGLVKPEKAVFGPGGHDDDFWRAHLPDTLAFVGGHLR
jgi:hypothetical protein